MGLDPSLSELLVQVVRHEHVWKRYVVYFGLLLCVELPCLVFASLQRLSSRMPNTWWAQCSFRVKACRLLPSCSFIGLTKFPPSAHGICVISETMMIAGDSWVNRQVWKILWISLSYLLVRSLAVSLQCSSGVEQNMAWAAHWFEQAVRVDGTDRVGHVQLGAKVWKSKAWGMFLSRRSYYRASPVMKSTCFIRNCHEFARVLHDLQFVSIILGFNMV